MYSFISRATIALLLVAQSNISGTEYLVSDSDPSHCSVRVSGDRHTCLSFKLSVNNDDEKYFWDFTDVDTGPSVTLVTDSTSLVVGERSHYYQLRYIHINGQTTTAGGFCSIHLEELRFATCSSRTERFFYLYID